MSTRPRPQSNPPVGVDLATPGSTYAVLSYSRFMELECAQKHLGNAQCMLRRSYVTKTRAADLVQRGRKDTSEFQDEAQELVHGLASIDDDDGYDRFLAGEIKKPCAWTSASAGNCLAGKYRGLAASLSEVCDILHTEMAHDLQKDSKTSSAVGPVQVITDIPRLCEQLADQHRSSFLGDGSMQERAKFLTVAVQDLRLAQNALIARACRWETLFNHVDRLVDNDFEARHAENAAALRPIDMRADDKVILDKIMRSFEVLLED